VGIAAGLPSFGLAVVALAGWEAEKLARHAPAPEAPFDDGGADLAARRDQAVGAVLRLSRHPELPRRVPIDDDVVKSWCMATNGLCWRRWRERLLTTRWEARRIVRIHRDAILDAAKTLYTRGSLRLRAEDLSGTCVSQDCKTTVGGN
jgi:hypothetical protein